MGGVVLVYFLDCLSVIYFSVWGRDGDGFGVHGTSTHTRWIIVYDLDASIEIEIVHEHFGQSMYSFS